MAHRERNSQYIAETVRAFRKMFKLTQENLAEAANLSTRTIEKAESGRHCPDEQTLRSIARALGLDVRVFEKPTPEQEARQRAEIERAMSKTALVPTRPVRSANDFLDMYGKWHACRIDISSVEREEALEIAAEMGDWLEDLDGIWELCSMSQRLSYSRSFVKLCRQIESYGYLCHMGHHQQRLREKGKPDLIFVVGLMSVRVKDDAGGARYALVQLEGAWESMEEGQSAFPTM